MGRKIMKKSVSSITIVKRRALIFVGVMLSMAVFSVVAWRTSASSDQGGNPPKNVRADDNDRDSASERSGNKELRERFESFVQQQSVPLSQDERQARIDRAKAVIRSDYFDEMEDAAQMREERLAGEIKIEGVIKPYDWYAASSKAQAKFSFAPFAEGLAPLNSSFTNVLINNPAADATAQNTQSETTIVLGPGGVVLSGFNDSGSFLGGVNKFTGFGRSANSGTTWTDQGALPTAAGNGDAGDPVMARNNTTGTILFSTLNFDLAQNLNIYRSTDNGVTFGAAINGAPGFTVATGSQDKQWIAVDNFGRG